MNTEKTNDELWTHFLVNSFFQHRKSTMHTCTYHFFKKYKIKVSKVELMAMPHYPKAWDKSLSLSSYIEAYYPSISTKLEATEEDDLWTRMEEKWIGM